MWDYIFESGGCTNRIRDPQAIHRRADDAAGIACAFAAGEESADFGML